MRAEFNTTCDLINGPSAASPGVVRESGPCRFVAELYEVFETYPFDTRAGYLTLDFSIPNGPPDPGTGGLLTFDWGFADRVAIPSGATPLFTVLFVEVVNYLSHPVYYRAHLAPDWF